MSNTITLLEGSDDVVDKTLSDHECSRDVPILQNIVYDVKIAYDFSPILLYHKQHNAMQHSSQHSILLPSFN